MAARVFICHAESDLEQADRLVAYLCTALPAASVTCGALPDDRELSADAADWLKRELLSAEVVIGLVTSAALASSEAAFQLGAAWALDKHVVLLLDPSGAGERLHMQLLRAEPIVLAPERMMRLAAELGERFGMAVNDSPASHAALEWLVGERASRPSGLGRPPLSAPPPPPAEPEPEAAVAPAEPEAAAEPAEAALAEPEAAPEAAAAAEPEPYTAPEPAPEPAPVDEAVLERTWEGEGEQHTAPGVGESIPPPPDHALDPAAQTPAAAEPTAAQWPTRRVSLDAGRAFSECVFDGVSGTAAAEALDASFGPFLTSLGADWTTLRQIGDAEIWMETADNLLAGVDDAAAHVNAWYRVGFELATLLGLVDRIGDAQDEQRAQFDALWQEAWQKLDTVARPCGFDEAALAELRGMLDNLRGPESERDYTFMARVLETTRQRADAADAA